eukprot:GHVH01004493.1.p1 GENE.GHVH01004493.1~~GHVH01004493.1.p1  ORF type:complete len:157 (+),score=14.82 GHVH01004493.1:32-502(+)
MTWRRIPPFTDTAFRLHSNPCVLVTMVENRRPKDDSLAAYLATQLNEAEQKGCLFLLNDLMRCLKKECTSEDFDWVLSERRGTTPPKGKHFWITEAKRATVALKLHEMTKKAPGSDAWTQITEVHRVFVRSELSDSLGLMMWTSMCFTTPTLNVER